MWQQPKCSQHTPPAFLQETSPKGGVLPPKDRAPAPFHSTLPRSHPLTRLQPRQGILRTAPLQLPSLSMDLRKRNAHQGSGGSRTRGKKQARYTGAHQPPAPPWPSAHTSPSPASAPVLLQRCSPTSLQSLHKRILCKQGLCLVPLSVLKHRLSLFQHSQNLALRVH